jgi:hypothetical protein
LGHIRYSGSNTRSGQTAHAGFTPSTSQSGRRFQSLEKPVFRGDRAAFSSRSSYLHRDRNDTLEPDAE